MSTVQQLPLTLELGGGTALQPVDAAIEYLRRHLGRVLPIYLVAVAPCSLAVFLLVDAVSSHHRSALGGAALLLAAAMVWRWGVLAVIQRRVQEDLRGEPSQRLRGNLVGILLLRLSLAVVMTWGGVLIIPVVYGLFVSGFIAPAMLESKAPPWTHLKEVMAMIYGAAARLARVWLSIVALAIIAVVCTLVGHVVLVDQVYAGLLGLDAVDIMLTIQSTTWLLCVAYFLFLLFDFCWSVVAVFLYYDLRARRLGTDLRMRLGLLEAEA